MLLRNYKKNNDTNKIINKTPFSSPWLQGKGAQQRCFDRYKSDEFFVVKQEQLNDSFTNTYNSFKDLETFLEFKKRWKGKQTFNEIIKEGSPCAEYYDLDAKWSDGWTCICNYLLEFLKLRAEYAEAEENTINNNKIKYHDLIVTEACNDTKLSLHIIINQPNYFNNTDDQKIWARGFSNWIKNNYPESKIAIDLSVYNKNSMMRCIGSYKIGEENRPFRPYGLAKKIKDKRLFYCSYVEKFYGVVGRVTYMYLPLEVPENLKQDSPKVGSNSYPTLSNKDELIFCEKVIQSLKPERSENYQDWFAIANALCSTLNGSKEGLKLFLEFSSKCPEKYNKNECIKLWDDISLRENKYSKGTLIHYFNEDNPKISNKLLPSLQYNWKTNCKLIKKLIVN